MKKMKTIIALLLTAVLALSLCACSAPAEPAQPQTEATPEANTEPAPEATEAPLEDGVVRVSSVDELLAAIAPGVTIELKAGNYDLSTATDYGKSLDGYYSWEEAYDGSELVIRNTDGLTIRAAGDAEILAVPRYANVMVFEGCEDIYIAGLTLGHTQEQGTCSGGVLNFRSCTEVRVIESKLFGCGTLGIEAADCRNIRVRDTAIYDCSYGAVNLRSCVDVQVDNCDIYKCEGFALFDLYSSYNCAVTNSKIHDNATGSFFSCSGREIFLGALDVYDNKFSEYMFLNTCPVTLEGCSLLYNVCTFWYGEDWGGSPSVPCVDADGKELDVQALSAMTLADRVKWEPKAEAPVIPEGSLTASEDGFVHVTNVDELLAAIAPNASIFLEPGNYTLSDASNYGGYIGDYYHWVEEFDGAGLVISNVDKLTISAAGKDEVNILALPRYADVIRFENCTELSLQGFTAGHTEGSSGCAGNVLGFNNCNSVKLENCGLFGCGVVGIAANNCKGMDISSTEVYKCSSLATMLFNCDEVQMTDCRFYDNAENAVFTEDSHSISWNGEELPVSAVTHVDKA